MNKKFVVLLVGLPRSGKSTWAKKQGLPIINPDSIRLALHGQRFIGLAEPFVWAICYLMIRALLLAGHEGVIVDATNVTEKRRKPYYEMFSNDYDVFEHHCSTSKEECIRRAKEWNDEEIIPIIEKMANEADFWNNEQSYSGV